METIARAKIQWFDDCVIQVPMEAYTQYARFGMSLEEIGDQSWVEPVTGVGMMRPLWYQGSSAGDED